MLRKVLLALAFMAFVCTSGYAKTYRLAVVQTWSANLQKLLDLCVEDAKASILPSGVNISFQFFPETDQTTSLFSALSVSDYCNNTQASVWGVIGFTYTANVLTAARVLASFNTPVISHSAVSTELSDKTNFPTFNRVVPADYGQARAVARLVAQYGWRRVGVIATSDLYGSKLTQAFVEQCQLDHVNVVQARSFQAGAITDMNAALQAMQDDDVRIIAVFVVSQDVSPVLDAIVKKGMHLPPYLWLGVYGNLPQQLFPQGTLGLDIYHNTSAPLYASLRSRVTARPGWTGTFSTANARLYDAGHLMARGITQLYHIEEACAASTALPADVPADSCTYMVSASTKRKLLNRLLRLQRFTGASGLIALDEKGDNTGAYQVMNQVALPPTYAANAANGVFTGQNTTWLKPIGMVDVSLKVTITSPVAWPGYNVLVPADRRGVRVGDRVASSLDGTILVLAFGTATISGWVSLILVEQAVASRVRVTTRTTVAWLVLAALAWGVGAWSACSIGATSLSLPDLPDDNNSISYKGRLIHSPSIIISLFAFGSFLIVIRGVKTRAGAKVTPTTDASTLNPSHLGQTATKYVSANSGSSSGHSSHSNSSSTGGSAPATEQSRSLLRRMLLDRLDRHLLLGAVLATAGIWLGNFMVLNSFMLPCTIRFESQAIVGGIFLLFPLVYLALYFVFHFRVTQLRFVGAFVTAGAVLAVHGLTLKGLEFTFVGSVESELDSDVTVVRLVAAIVVAVISFLFMGLNVTRLKLSRDMLDNYLLKTQKRVRSLEKEVAAQKEIMEQQQTVINLIHLLRPLVRKEHFVLKNMEDSMEARLSLYGGSSGQQLIQKYGSNGNADKVRGAAMSPTPQSFATASEDSGVRPTVNAMMRQTDSPVQYGSSSHLRVSTGLDSPMRRNASATDTDKKQLPDPTLQDILANPITYEIFKDAVLGHHNTENMAFHADVQQYKREPEDNRLAAARDIAATFVQANAPHCINISGTLRQSILGKIPTATDDAPPRNLFDAAETEIIRLLVLNDFSRFRDSEAYATCKMVLFATQHLKELRIAERQVRFEAQLDSQAGNSLVEKERAVSPRPEEQVVELPGASGRPSVVIEPVIELPRADHN